MGRNWGTDKCRCAETTLSDDGLGWPSFFILAEQKVIYGTLIGGENVYGKSKRGGSFDQG